MNVTKSLPASFVIVPPPGIDVSVREGKLAPASEVCRIRILVCGCR